MARLRRGTQVMLSAVILAVTALIPMLACAQEYKIFKSEEYGFSMKYPAEWVKIDNPKGNYYVVFQSPEASNDFRNRIQVAAHKPIKDPISTYLQEFRNGIKDLQKASGEKAKDKQTVRILDEGEFRSDVPGAYFFYVNALDDKSRIWLDVIVVFYKHDQSLVRVACLTPSKSIDRFHKMFNDVLLSVKFEPATAAGVEPSRPTAVPPPQPGTSPGTAPQAQPPAPLVTRPEATTPAPRVQPGPPTGTLQEQPAPPAVTPRSQAMPQPQPGQLPEQVQPPAGPRPQPRGPLKRPSGPSTGIVE